MPAREKCVIRSFSFLRQVSTPQSKRCCSSNTTSELSNPRQVKSRKLSTLKQQDSDTTQQRRQQSSALATSKQNASMLLHSSRSPSAAATLLACLLAAAALCCTHTALAARTPAGLSRDPHAAASTALTREREDPQAHWPRAFRWCGCQCVCIVACMFVISLHH